MVAVSQSAHNDAKLDSVQMLAYVVLNRLILSSLNDVSPSSAHTISQATNTTGVKTTGTTNFTADGVLASKAATDPMWTLTGAAVVAPASGAFFKYLLAINAAGTASVVQSSVRTDSLANCVYASMPDGAAVVGYVTITLASGTTFTPGTTSLTAAGVTAAYFVGTDKALLPLLADASSGVELLIASVGSGQGIPGLYA